jgi:hypothetical protein
MVDVEEVEWGTADEEETGWGAEETAGGSSEWGEEEFEETSEAPPSTIGGGEKRRRTDVAIVRANTSDFLGGLPDTALSGLDVFFTQVPYAVGRHDGLPGSAVLATNTDGQAARDAPVGASHQKGLVRVQTPPWFLGRGRLHVRLARWALRSPVAATHSFS